MGLMFFGALIVLLCLGAVVFSAVLVSVILNGRVKGYWATAAAALLVGVLADFLMPFPTPRTAFMDLESLLQGTFSPVTGFLVVSAIFCGALAVSAPNSLRVTSGASWGIAVIALLRIAPVIQWMLR